MFMESNTNIPKPKRKWNGHGLSIEGSRLGAKTLWTKFKEEALAGAKKGGQVAGSHIHTCPNCARTIRGNVFFYHLKKCTVTLDK
jgi:hypothetical protein